MRESASASTELTACAADLPPDVSGDYAEPPTPSVFDQWVAGIDAKHDAWSANEQARVEAENARVEAEKAREDKETGYVAQAKAFAEAAQASEVASASSKTAAEEAKTAAEVHATGAAQSAAIAQVSADNALNYANNAAYSAARAKISEENAKASEEKADAVAANAEIASTAAANAAASEAAAREAQAAAEKARDDAQGIAGGDFASVHYVDNKAAEAETKANAYTDQKISAIPTPDVSGQIGDHNKATDAHADIRKAASDAETNAKAYTDQKIAAIPTPDVSGQINTHNSSASAHSDIRTALDGKAPIAHAVDADTYGTGSSTVFGHVKLSSATTSTSGPGKGIAATPAAVKLAYDLANEAKTAADSKAPMYTYGTTDLTAGSSSLESGKLYFVYE